jgi:hypothetical protein
MKTQSTTLAACVVAAGLATGFAARADMAPPAQETLDILKKYAPLVYLAQGETFLPSSLEDYFQHMHLECDGKTVQKNIFQVTQADLPAGQGGPHDNAHCRFVTNDAMSGPYDIKPFFNGRLPSAAAPVPVYVYVYDMSNPRTFSVQYNTFYPYNKGKMACPMFAPGSECLSPFGRREFDDHVADWELMSIRFEHGVPLAVHVGAHGNGEPDEASTYYPVSSLIDGGATTWQGSVYNKGNPYQTGVELQWSGTHPIAYSAWGSHGIWATPGAHTYAYAAGDALVDHTSQGAPWETWNAVALASDPKYATLLQHFEGDWGNYHMGSNVCDYVRATIDSQAGGLGWLGRMAYEVFSGNDACDAMNTALRQTYQLNTGPSIPDRDRDTHYLNPLGRAPCEDAPMVADRELLGLGREGALYRKTLPDGAWSKVAGYASTHKIVSIAARADGTLIGLDAGGTFYQMSQPYMRDWQASDIPAKPGLTGISVQKDGTLIAVKGTSLWRVAPDGARWEMFGVAVAGLQPPPTSLAQMPNGHYLVGTSIGIGYGGYMIEYANDNGIMEPVSLGIADRRTLEQPYYSVRETANTVSQKSQSFVYLPNGTLVWSTESGSSRLMTWAVNTCGASSQGQIVNDGGPQFGIPGTDASWPQWKSMAVVKAF